MVRVVWGGAGKETKVNLCFGSTQGGRGYGLLGCSVDLVSPPSTSYNQPPILSPINLAIGPLTTSTEHQRKDKQRITLERALQSFSVGSSREGVLGGGVPKAPLGTWGSLGACWGVLRSLKLCAPSGDLKARSNCLTDQNAFKRV